MRLLFFKKALWCPILKWRCFIFNLSFNKAMEGYMLHSSHRFPTSCLCFGIPQWLLSLLQLFFFLFFFLLRLPLHGCVYLFPGVSNELPPSYSDVCRGLPEKPGGMHAPLPPSTACVPAWLWFQLVNQL